MKQILVLLFLLSLNSLYGKYYSLQFFTSKGKKSAYEFKKRFCDKKCFIYITNRGYYTVREGIFRNKKEAYKYAKKHFLNNFVIVPLDINKLHIKKQNKFSKTPLIKIQFNKKCKSKKRYLTPCRYKVCNTNKNFPWEINLSSIKVNPKVPIYYSYSIGKKRSISEKNLTMILISKEYNKSQNFISNEILRYYIDLYAKATKGQKPIHRKRIYNLRLLTKLGLHYGFDFYYNYHFFTDDRILVYLENYSEYTKIHKGAYLDINEFYIKSYNLNYNMLNFVIGRKNIKDYNSIFYNNSLDLVGFYNLHDLLLYEIYFGTRFNDLQISDNYNQFKLSIKNIKFLIAKASYEYAFEKYINLLYLYENSYHTSTAQKRKGNWFSIRFHNNILKQADKLLLYGDISYLNGRKKLHGNSSGKLFLAGFMYEPQKWNNKGIGASIVHADDEFFQPYISNNKSDFLSKNLSFRYFGFFLDPELSNINILNLYFKYKKPPFSTYMLSLHKYYKDNKNKKIYSSRFTVDTDNKKDIGSEIDIFYKYNKELNNYWFFGFSYFFGGDAFKKTTDVKDGFSVKVNYRYYW